MYSLYRAWLMRDAVAAASLATPPDVVITVGSAADGAAPAACQFVAHKHLVSLHSGYLKSLLAADPPPSAVAVPSVAPDTFAPLLSFMYTGYLDLTHDNIYSVLLATHLLHMPRALDLCRAFLVHHQPELQRGAPPPLFPFPSNPSIVKPIPSRKYHGFPHPFWSPVTVPPLLLHTSPSGPFRSVQQGEAPRAEGPVPELRLSPLPSTSRTTEREGQGEECKERATSPSTASPCPSNASFTSDERTVHVAKSPTRKAPRKPQRKAQAENGKTVLDVACCDGPVRFHRVLNESYGLSLDQLIEDGQVDDEAPQPPSDKEYLDCYPKTHYLKSKSDEKFSNFMHQQMLNSNMYKKNKATKGVIQLRKIIEKEVPGHNENDHSEGEEAPGGEAPGGPDDKVYTCVYCNHTFKSQYCYQKHARRHINPVDVGKEGGGKNFVIFKKVLSTTKCDGKEGAGKEVRREVRLLDMNVQYYPCKTCGSKFPSYYFVHKHRKLCHSGEDAADDEDHISTDHTDSSELAPHKPKN